MPFDVARAYWYAKVYEGVLGVPHACYSTEEFVVALSGSIEIEIECASGIKTFNLNYPDKGVYIPAMSWRSIFSSEAAAVLILSSTPYDPNDCISDYGLFHTLINQNDR